jgi:HPt (histidine-containing phosphotransfer) domain-containing protein
MVDYTTGQSMSPQCDFTMNLESLPPNAVLDVEGTLTRFEGDQQLFREIITFFLEDSPPLLTELRRAAEVAHPQAVRSTAHALKGLIAGCGGVRAAQAAQRVENAGQEGKLDNIDVLIDTLENEVDLLRQVACAYQS